jgi:hypothetical protein
MKKVNFTVIISKEVPVEIEYIEGDTNEIINDKCVKQALSKVNEDSFDWKANVVINTMDFIKNKLRS